MRACLAVAGIAAACTAVVPARALGAQQPGGRSLPPDPALRTGTLPNGMRYYVRRNAVPVHRAAVWLVVDAGSVLEDDDQRGFAHFVEHMAFNGTSRFPKKRLIEFVESVGMVFGADLNASTGFDETSYQLEVPAEPAILDTTLMIVEDWMRGVTFDPKEVEAERGVVFEERRLREGPQLRQYQLHAPLLLGPRYGARSPIGLGGTILHGSRAALVRFYGEWYRPDLMTVIAVGDFDPAAMEAKVRARLGAIPRQPGGRPRPPVVFLRRDTAAASVAADPKAREWSAQIIFPKPGRDTAFDEAALRRRSVGRALYEVLNERLTALVRAKDSPVRGAEAGEEDLGRRTLVHAIGLTAKEPTTLEVGIVAVRGELARLARAGVTPGELERVRGTLAEGAARLAAATWTSSELAQRYTFSALSRIPVLDYRARAEWERRAALTVTGAEIRALATEMDTARGVLLLASVPKDDPMGLPSREVLLEALKTGARRRLPSLRDTAVAGPLVAAAPAPGRVVRRRVVAGLGVTEWILSNGARVLLKPTLWDKDALVVRAVSAGGTSLASDAEYPSAAVASDLVRVSGLGRYDAKALAARLSTVVSDWSVGIDPDRQRVRVAGTPRHAEALFQVLHLAFTAPRLDTAEVAKWRYDQRRTPTDPLEFAMLRASAQRHPRARPVVGPVVDSVDADKALAFYRERFADAGRYTFVLVGNFAPEAVRPLVERYIGGLPGRPGAPPERARDLGIRPPAEGVRRIVVGDDSLSVTHVVFDGAAPYTPDAPVVMGAVGAILSRRLFLRLREDMSGTYGVGANGGAYSSPYEHQKLEIEFRSAPERAEELQRAMFAVIDTFVRRGPGAEEIRDLRTRLRRRQEVERQESGYWVELLSDAAVQRRTLDDLAARERQIAAITPETIRAAARRLFADHRYVLVTSLPVRLAPTQRDELLTNQW